MLADQTLCQELRAGLAPEAHANCRIKSFQLEIDAS